ncbi:helix-turn-helix domain-containing protein [Micromonospora sp. SH-82]|uniref:helix-turn-helix domain-containing protein n=1 Tax=Micromonospora sp. SH-82 TaxID=3132938 RepID=UPI003EBD1A73
MTQQMFADRLGKSKSWVDKVERGIRELNKLDVLHEIAAALRVDVALLQTGPLSGGAVPPADAELRGLVDGVQASLARYGPAAPARSLDRLARNAAYGWTTFRHGRLRRVLADLPGLLTQSRQARADAPGADAVAVEVYQLAATVLRKVGAAEVAWLAADRAMAVSVGLGDPVLAARAAVPLGGVVRELAQPRPAFELCVSVAHDLAPTDPLAVDEERLSVHGSLLLQAAMAAAQLGDPLTVLELVDQAAACAARVGDGQDHHHTGFGPALVDGVRVAAALALESPAVAVAAHEQAVTRPGWWGLPAGTRADHLVDAARGYAGTGQDAEAARTLLEADRIAPEEVRVRPAARAAVALALRQADRPDPRLVMLGESLGLDGAR